MSKSTIASISIERRDPCRGVTAVRRLLDVEPAAARAVGGEVAVAARLLAVEERDRDDGPRHRVRQRAGELEHDGDAGGAVVGADEAGHVLGVVMGADDDRIPRSRPGSRR